MTWTPVKETFVFDTSEKSSFQIGLKTAQGEKKADFSNKTAAFKLVVLTSDEGDFWSCD